MKHVKEEIESCGYENVGYGKRVFPPYSGRNGVARPERKIRCVMGGLTGVPLSIPPCRLSGHSLGDE